MKIKITFSQPSITGATCEYALALLIMRVAGEEKEIETQSNIPIHQHRIR